MVEMFTRIWQYGNKIRCVGFKDPIRQERHTSKDDLAAWYEEIREAAYKGEKLELIYRVPPEIEALAPTGERRPEHISRSKSRIRELAFCNKWDYFVTITLSSENQTRSDLQALKKRWNQCLKDYAAKLGCRPKYLLIPELHKDGEAWHLHGLFAGFAPASLVKNEHGYLDIPYFRKRFGWVSLSKIKDPDRCASYITKYITKDLAAGEKLKSGEHLFFASKGLNGAVLLYQGDFNFPWQFENDYVKIYEGDDLQCLLTNEY